MVSKPASETAVEGGKPMAAMFPGSRRLSAVRTTAVSPALSPCACFPDQSRPASRQAPRQESFEPMKRSRDAPRTGEFGVPSRRTSKPSIREGRARNKSSICCRPRIDISQYSPFPGGRGTTIALQKAAPARWAASLCELVIKMGALMRPGSPYRWRLSLSGASFSTCPLYAIA